MDVDDGCAVLRPLSVGERWSIWLENPNDDGVVRSMRDTKTAKRLHKAA
jgi:hypothetical protein